MNPAATSSKKRHGKKVARATSSKKRHGKEVARDNSSKKHVDVAGKRMKAQYDGKDYFNRPVNPFWPLPDDVDNPTRKQMREYKNYLLYNKKHGTLNYDEEGYFQCYTDPSIEFSSEE